MHTHLHTITFTCLHITHTYMHTHTHTHTHTYTHTCTHMLYPKASLSAPLEHKNSHYALCKFGWSNLWLLPWPSFSGINHIIKLNDLGFSFSTSFPPNCAVLILSPLFMESKTTQYFKIQNVFSLDNSKKIVWSWNILKHYYICDDIYAKSQCRTKHEIFVKYCEGCLYIQIAALYKHEIFVKYCEGYLYITALYKNYLLLLLLLSLLEWVSCWRSCGLSWG